MRNGRLAVLPMQIGGVSSDFHNDHTWAASTRCQQVDRGV
jgi:hypothetical protein